MLFNQVYFYTHETDHIGSMNNDDGSCDIMDGNFHSIVEALDHLRSFSLNDLFSAVGIVYNSHDRITLDKPSYPYVEGYDTVWLSEDMRDTLETSYVPLWRPYNRFNHWYGFIDKMASGVFMESTYQYCCEESEGYLPSGEIICDDEDPAGHYAQYE